MRACLIPIPFVGTERKGTRLLTAVCYVPSLNLIFNDPGKILSLTAETDTNGSLQHMPHTTAVQVHIRCPAPSINAILLPVRSGRSVLLNKKKGVTAHTFPLPKNHCSTRAACNLFARRNQSVPFHLAHHFLFRSLHFSLVGIKTRS